MQGLKLTNRCALGSLQALGAIAAQHHDKMYPVGKEIPMRPYLLPIFLVSLLCLQAPQLAAHEAETYFKAGIQAFNQEQLPEAIDAFNKAIRSYPGYAQAHYMLGTIYYQQKRYQQAQQAFQRLLSLTLKSLIWATSRRWPVSPM